MEMLPNICISNYDIIISYPIVILFHYAIIKKVVITEENYFVIVFLPTF